MRDKCILPFLITERLEFFQLTQADLPELEILLGDPEIMYCLLYTSPSPRDCS
mgnify:CR=1 FL=1